MNEDKEKISAWLDDALEYDEARSIDVEQKNCAFSTAARYQMIGDALRGNVTNASMTDISANIREAISHEPALSPAVKPAHSRQKTKPLFDFGSWLRPVGGLAVAATVAMVMVVTLTDRHTTTGSGSAVIANVGQQPVQAVPVSNPAPAYANPAVAMPAVNLNSYVNEHSEYAAQDTMQGMMPYARAVSYGSENNPARKNLPEDSKALINQSK
ncbi:MAG: RseA family anti-sigma factor [Gammaproteobacteria bacterium]|jgi:sigma-E factor negative regulatory protein RseA